MMLVWVKRCTCYAKDVGNLLVMIFAIIAFINSIFRVAWFYSDVLFSSHIGFTGWNVLRCLDICSRKRGQTNNGQYKHHKFEIVAFSVSSFPTIYRMKALKCIEMSSVRLFKLMDQCFCCSGHLGTMLAVPLPHPLYSTRTQCSRKSLLTACPMLFV